MPDLLIRNADYLMTVDKDRRIIRDGAVAIKGGRIAAVGKTAEVAASVSNAEVIDARGKLVTARIVRHPHPQCPAARARPRRRSLFRPGAAVSPPLGRRIAHGRGRRALRRAALSAGVAARRHDLLRRSRQLLRGRDRAGGARERHARHDRAHRVRHGPDADGLAAEELLRADGRCARARRRDGRRIRRRLRRPPQGLVLDAGAGRVLRRPAAPACEARREARRRHPRSCL